MEPNQKPGFLKCVWLMVYPLLVYEAVSIAVSGLASSLLMIIHHKEISAVGNYAESVSLLMEYLYKNYVYIAAVTGLLTLPLLLLFMKKDRQREQEAGIYVRYSAVSPVLYLLPFFAGAFGSLFVNHFLMFSGLMELLYGTYEETAELLFQGQLWIELLVEGMLIPVVEECIFRGLIYRRLRWISGPKAALWISALFFGLFHGNLLQAIYAGILGVLFALLYERFQSLWAAILAHAGGNLLSLAVSEVEELQWFYETDARMLLLTGAVMLLFVLCIYLIYSLVNPQPISDKAAAELPQDRIQV